MTMRILTLDGGGVFGVGTAELLRDTDVRGLFSAFGGTSIGSVLASWYALGRSPASLPDLMSDALTKVFDRKWYSVFNVTGPKWPSAALETFLREHFGMTMGSVQKPLYIVSLDFSNRTPRVFSTLHDPDVLVCDAILASVAGPTYFKPRITGKIGLVDGGLFANNPSVCTAAGVCKQYSMEFDQMSVFSVGTGQYVRDPIDMSSAARWNLLQWASKILGVMLAGSCEEGWHYIAQQMPFRAYARYNDIPLDDGWDFDDPRVMPEVRRRAVTRKLEFERVLREFVQGSVL